MLSLSLVSFCASAGATGELSLSEPLPVFQAPVRIYVPESAGGSPSKTKIVVRSESGKIVAQGKIADLEGRHGLEFTPSETGYYTAQVQGAEGMSLRFPVVSHPLQFLVWPPLAPEEAGLRCLSSYVVVLNQNEDLAKFWHARGSKVLGAAAAGSRQIDLKEPKEDNINRLVSSWTQALKAVDGVYIDEFGGYQDEDGKSKVRIINEALLKFREANSGTLIWAAVAGAPILEQCAGLRNAGATALLETYENWLAASFATHRFYDYADRRIEAARHTDLITEKDKAHRALIYLGYDGLHGGTSKQDLEAAVRYMRKQCPEMTGMAFYASGKSSQWLQDAKIRSFIEELCERYFVRPVLEIDSITWDGDVLRVGSAQNIYVRLNNIGAMHARNVKVRLFTAPLGGARENIGELTIPEVVSGQFRDLVNSDLEGGSYKVETMGGREIPVFNIVSTINPSHHAIRFTWTPEQAGAYALYAVIEPSEGVTLLEGVCEQKVVVSQRAQAKGAQL